MSLDAVNAVLHHSRAVGTDKVVLLGIAWHLGPDPEEGCWPSINKLAKYANVETRAVQKAIKRLEELGELERFLNAGVGKDNHRPNCYYIHLDCFENTCTGYPKHQPKGVTMTFS